jgi:hypothetical protein
MSRAGRASGLNCQHTAAQNILIWSLLRRARIDRHPLRTADLALKQSTRPVTQRDSGCSMT